MNCTPDEMRKTGLFSSFISGSFDNNPIKLTRSLPENGLFMIKRALVKA